MISGELKGEITGVKNWSDLVAVVKDLPPLPVIATRALKLVGDPNCNTKQLTSLLQKDAALAARVLKIANSAMYAAQRQITTLTQAIMIIGFKTLRGIIIAATLRQTSRQFGALEKAIWHNSLSTATIAQKLCVLLRKPYADELFLSGLLHDLGKIVLLMQMPMNYTQVIELVESGKQYYEAENEVFGYNHTLLGALVAKKWNFSDDACQIMLHHHDPLELPTNDPIYQKTAIIQLANALSHTLGHGHLGNYPDLKGEAQILFQGMGINQQAAQDFIEEMPTVVVEQMLSLID
ncbi:MAG: HDOD domain-containing protein [Deltaproteobacteria bacterium]|nr:HDOD domain-containing protein [Deltaproteobacteria bacterium]